MATFFWARDEPLRAVGTPWAPTGNRGNPVFLLIPEPRLSPRPHLDQIQGEVLPRLFVLPLIFPPSTDFPPRRGFLEKGIFPLAKPG